MSYATAPNNMHVEVNTKAIRAGSHFSEKPLALNTTESRAMLDCLGETRR